MAPSNAAPIPTRTEDEAIWRAFEAHSRTFSLAARLLPAPVQMPVATLYLFCRTVDSIADDHALRVGPARALEAVYRVERQLRETLAGRPPDELLWRRLAEVHETFELCPAPLFELIDGAVWDLQGRGIEHGDDLLDYSNLVGGSVGVMMLPFLTEDRAALPVLEPSARALGVAMQITNILRDVGEDLRALRRLYVPRTWLAEHGLAPEDLAAPRPPQSYPMLLEAMMERAEALYEDSLPCIDALRPQVRTGIRAAARMYREILNEVRALGYDNLNHRACVPLHRKLRLIVHDDYTRRRERLRERHAARLEA